ncbi:MAG TPA: SRPBCC family protein [Streptosporangiaceae bacterium]|jgi:uncharacterized protein YndB with AHSA1/START domain
MTSNPRPGSSRLLGTLGSADGKGVVRIEDRYDTGIDDLWSALTDPARLARWYGEVEGDLRPGGEYRAHVTMSGWESTGRVEVCEPPRRLRVTGREAQDSYDEVIEATLTADGGQTILVIEARGMPLERVHFYGAGWQIHAEDLAACIAGRAPGEGAGRWDELVPPYQEMAAGIGE